jgi:hypothetical protein
MPEFVPRFLVVLTGIIAFLALFIGLRDYFEKPKHANPATIIGNSSEVQSNDVHPRKKTVLAKAKQAQRPKSEVLAETTAGMQDLLIRDFVRTDTLDEPQGPLAAQPKPGEFDAALSHTACVPLPNSTKPEDVDAPYYRKWAREYGCNPD